MNKKYQVFISSTYTDLKVERSKVFQTLMELDCIPAGMELFPATDEEQFEFIKRIIDDCDYYLLIIGGRYGSVTPEGISYTEKEYDYATAKGLKIVTLIHGSPNTISYENSEHDPSLRKQLEAFREKSSTGRLVKFWKTADELPGLVALSMSKTIRMFPAIGWIRANLGESLEASREIIRLSTENHELREKIKELDLIKTKKEAFHEISNTLEKAKRNVQVFYSNGKDWEHQEETSLEKIFEIIAPELLQENTTAHINEILGFYLRNDKERDVRDYWAIPINSISDWLADLSALDLVEPSTKKHPVADKNEYWQLTQSGKEFLKSTRLKNMNSHS